MSNQFEKLKNKLCLKVCLKSKKASPDYEYVSYTQQDTNKVTTTGDNKEMKTIPKSKRENPQFHSTQIETSMNSLYKTALNNTLNRVVDNVFENVLGNVLGNLPGSVITLSLISVSHIN